MKDALEKGTPFLASRYIYKLKPIALPILWNELDIPSSEKLADLVASCFAENHKHSIGLDDANDYSHILAEIGTPETQVRNLFFFGQTR